MAWFRTTASKVIAELVQNVKQLLSFDNVVGLFPQTRTLEINWQYIVQLLILAWSQLVYAPPYFYFERWKTRLGFWIKLLFPNHRSHKILLLAFTTCPEPKAHKAETIPRRRGSIVAADAACLCCYLWILSPPPPSLLRLGWHSPTMWYVILQ